MASQGDKGGLFSNLVFHLWPDNFSLGKRKKSYSDLVEKVTSNGGLWRDSGFLAEDQKKLKVILFNSLRHLREHAMSMERIRRMGADELLKFDLCVLKTFVEDSVAADAQLKEIEQYTFQALMKQKKKDFAGGDSVDPCKNFYVGRKISLPEVICDRTRAPVMMNLYNHSQAGKTMALCDIANDPSASAGLHFVLCRFSKSDNLYMRLFISFSLAAQNCGGLGNYVQNPEKTCLKLDDLFKIDLFDSKPSVVLCDNLESMTAVQDANVFFDFLKGIREDPKSYPFFQAFVGVGTYRSNEVPTLIGSNFKFREGESQRVDTYFKMEEVLMLRDELLEETGIFVNSEICQEIVNATNGHPGFVSFYFGCLLTSLKDRGEQLDLTLWRRISSGLYFYTRLAESNLGQKINKFLMEQPEDDLHYDSILKGLLTSNGGYQFRRENLVQTKIVDRLADFGMIKIDKSDVLFFSCDVVWAQTMTRYCGVMTAAGPTFTAKELESHSMFDFLKSTLPFIDSSAIKTQLASKGHKGLRVPSEYLYQFELNRAFTRAGNGLYRVFNEANHLLGARRADIRIVNGVEWSLLELMSHANETQFVEHVRRTIESYSILNPRHLVVVQFHTDWDYKPSETIMAEINRTKDVLEVFIVIHDSDYSHISIEHVANGPAAVIDVRQENAKQALGQNESTAVGEPAAASTGLGKGTVTTSILKAALAAIEQYSCDKRTLPALSPPVVLPPQVTSVTLDGGEAGVEKKSAAGRMMQVPS